jgi:hypothetical protein
MGRHGGGSDWEAWAMVIAVFPLAGVLIAWIMTNGKLLEWLLS